MSAKDAADELLYLLGRSLCYFLLLHIVVPLDMKGYVWWQIHPFISKGHCNNRMCLYYHPEMRQRDNANERPFFKDSTAVQSKQQGMLTSQVSSYCCLSSHDRD